MIAKICQHEHRLNEMGIFAGDNVYDLGGGYYKTFTNRPVIFRVPLLVQELTRSEKMLSKHKMTEVTATWIRNQLEEAQIGGHSLKDDNDGCAVRVEGVRQSGTLIFLDISCRDEDGNIKDLEYCLLLQQKMPAEMEPSVFCSKPTSLSPTPADLSTIDGETA